MDARIFRGCVPAIMTPCRADRTPDFAALVKKAEDLIGAGMNGVVYCGSMGDWPLLTDEQRQEGVGALAEAGVPVIVGTGAQNPARAIAHARHAQEVGARGLMVIPRVLSRGTSPAAQRAHFAGVLSAAPDLPAVIYNTAKLHAHQMTRSYRHAYGLFACCGILFNHESPLRAPGFVTRKIARAAAAIAAGKQREVRLGNLDSRRDFGYSPEYVEAMWLILQQENPGDYVVATGEAHSIHQFAEKAFQIAGISFEEHLVTDASLLRPADPGLVCGNPAKARRELGWQAKTGFEDLVRIMVEAEMERVVQDPK